MPRAIGSLESFFAPKLTFLLKTQNSEDPILAYSAAGEINTVQWGPIHNDWIAITYDQTLEILRV